MECLGEGGASGKGVGEIEAARGHGPKKLIEKNSEYVFYIIYR